MSYFKAVTFDFWGTLVDVDTSGALGAERVLETVGVTDTEPSEVYFAWDAATVRRYRSDVWRPYIEWGALGLRDVLEPRGVRVPEARWIELAEILISTMTSEAKPHPEVPDIIARLKSHFLLMPITNMDDRLFDMNPFRREFDLVMTAQRAKAYKPSALIFLKAADRLGVPVETILHTSLAQFADVEGAMPVGMKVAWINRGGEAQGTFTPRPQYEFPDLTGLAQTLAI